MDNQIELKVDKDYKERIDVFLTKRIQRITRNKLQKFIKMNCILVNDNKVKPSYQVKAGDVIRIRLPEVKSTIPIKSNIPLQIIYEDDYLIAINKDAGIVSHPAGRYRENTLIQGVYNYFDKKGELAKLITPVFKPTLIHRLDKDTSGIILVAKTLNSYRAMQKQFIEKTIYKEYWAIVEGYVKFDSDLIYKRISKSKIHFAKMTVAEYGKESQTIYKVQKRFKNFSLIVAIPKTGRTHQIRVHLSSIGHPVLCDAVYGKRKILYQWQLKGLGSSKFDSLTSSPLSMNDIPLINRQALHAKKIEFKHPVDFHTVTIDTDLPLDFMRTLDALQSIT